MNGRSDCPVGEHRGPIMDRWRFANAGPEWARMANCAACGSSIDLRAFAVDISTDALIRALQLAGCSVTRRSPGRLVAYTGQAAMPLTAERDGVRWTVRGAWHGILVDAVVHDLPQLTHLIESVDRMVMEYREETRPSLGFLRRLRAAR